MKRSKVFQFLIETVLLVSLLLSSCAAPATTVPTQPAAAAPTQPAAAAPTQPEAAAPTQPAAAAPTQPEAKPSVTINVILDDRDGHRKIASDKLPEFEKMTGIKVNLELLPETEMRDKINVDLMSGAGTYDLIMTGFMQEAAYIKSGALEPLDDYIANKVDPQLGFDPNYHMPKEGAFATDLHIWDGKRYGMPMWVYELHDSLMFRADLLKEKGLTLSDPPTIDEVEAAAAALTDKENGKYGWAMRGIKGMNQWVFLPVAQLFGAKVINSTTYEPLVNQPEMVKALDWYVMMEQKYGPPDVANYGWYEVMEFFALGKVAMIQDADVLIYYALDVEGQQIQGKVGTRVMAQIPGQPTSVGLYSWALGIPSSSKHKDEAWKFLQWLYTDENTVIAGWATTPKATQPNFDKVQVFPGESPAFKATGDYVSKMKADIYEVRKLPEAAELMEILGAAISSAVSGEKSSQEALDAANKEMRDLLEAKGYFKK